MFLIHCLLTAYLGYPNDRSTKLDAQLAVYLPYFKWSPPVGRREAYPSLSDYAQPTILSPDAGPQGVRHFLPIAVHQMWLFVTGRSMITLYNTTITVIFC